MSGFAVWMVLVIDVVFCRLGGFGLFSGFGRLGGVGRLGNFGSLAGFRNLLFLVIWAVFVI